ncbi:Aprataxin and PNK-like factor [Sarcoptes scabiei]|nr:Aprataxin and PNK-like factor [Sarcoptes scabiei]
MTPMIVGYWGKPTSTIDWCEENYVVWNFVAEFWNTISNLAIMIPSMIGYYYSNKNNLELQSKLCFISLFFVGLGSWMFHMTLLYEMQLFDELPMLWGSLILIYNLVIHNYSIYEQNQSKNKLLKFFLIFYGLLSMIVYISFKTPILFQAAYVILVTYLLYLDILLIRNKPCNKTIFYCAIIFYYSACLLWLIDNFFCEKLRNFRSNLSETSSVILKLFGPFTQLHAWWHVFAGYGTYLHILFCTHSRYLDKKHPKLVFKFKWTVGLILDRSNNNDNDGDKLNHRQKIA